jgi:hypothetical protein
MLVSEERPTVNLQTKLAAWHKPDAEALFEIGSGRLLTTLAATEIPVLQRLWELAAYQECIGPVLRPSRAQVFSSLENHADRRTSSLVKLWPARGCEFVMPFHTRCTHAS